MMDLILITLIAFVVADYALGRANVQDNLRLIVAIAFAVVVLLVKAGTSLGA